MRLRGEGTQVMPAAIRWGLIALVVVIVGVVPIVFYRAVYSHGKRLREVAPGQVYRSGQMTVAGFRDTIRRLGIRTVLNLQNDFPDPDIQLGFWDKGTIKESEMCRQLGVRVCPDRARPGQPTARVRIGPMPSISSCS